MTPSPLLAESHDAHPHGTKCGRFVGAISYGGYGMSALPT
jgi:hypothetical protein